MTDDYTQDWDYCAALLKAHDEDRWLASRYASAEDRRLLSALYAFHIELRRIPAAVSEPPLGEIRLQWWREALSEIRDGKPARAHPVVAELAAAGLASDRFQSRIDQLIDAAARPLYGEGFSDFNDLVDWLGDIEGAVDGLAVLLLGGGDTLAETAERAGAAFALAREGAHHAPELANAALEFARSEAATAKPALRAAAPSIAPALLHLALVTSYARRGSKPFAVSKRLQIFFAMAIGRF